MRVIDLSFVSEGDRKYGRRESFSLFCRVNKNSECLKDPLPDNQGDYISIIRVEGTVYHVGVVLL